MFGSSMRSSSGNSLFTSLSMLLILKIVVLLKRAQIAVISSPQRLKFSEKASDIFGYPVWNLLHVSYLLPRILRWPFIFLENFVHSWLCSFFDSVQYEVERSALHSGQIITKETDPFSH